MNAEASGMAVTGLRSAAVVDDELRLVLNNAMAAIEDGRVRIIAFLEPQALDARVINRLEVVFEEVISNIVRHGFTPKSDQTIAVTVAVNTSGVELSFEDDGVPFDPLTAPKPEPFTAIETARLGGLGIAAVRKMSASVRYEPLGAGRARRDLGGRVFEPNNRLVVTIATPA
jgi:anti-sigma regulatory factor (Ser/Thr protein kinase)